MSISVKFMLAPFINIHTHKANNQSLALVNLGWNGVEQTNSCASAGCHPWDIEKYALLDVLQNLEFLNIILI